MTNEGLKTQQISTLNNDGNFLTTYQLNMGSKREIDNPKSRMIKEA
jgi:hypothetical protein